MDIWTRLDPRRALSMPWVYEGFQRAVGKDKLRRRFVNEYVHPRTGEIVVDIGCGPGDLLRFLPEVDYTGFDVDESYIRAARARFDGRARFLAGDIDELRPLVTSPVDVVLAVGVLHHVDDVEAVRILSFAKEIMGPDGRFLAVEPHLFPGQNLVAKALIKADRGGHVRDAASYEALCSSVFGNVQAHWDNKMFRVPYSKVILESSGGLAEAGAASTRDASPA